MTRTVFSWGLQRWLRLQECVRMSVFSWFLWSAETLILVKSRQSKFMPIYDKTDKICDKKQNDGCYILSPPPSNHIASFWLVNEQVTWRRTSMWEQCFRDTAVIFLHMDPWGKPPDDSWNHSVTFGQFFPSGAVPSLGPVLRVMEMQLVRLCIDIIGFRKHQSDYKEALFVLLVVKRQSASCCVSFRFTGKKSWTKIKQGSVDLVSSLSALWLVAADRRPQWSETAWLITWKLIQLPVQSEVPEPRAD